MNNWRWKAWKVGFIVSLILSFLVALSGLQAGMNWKQFVAVFGASAVTHLGAFLYQHPVEKALNPDEKEALQEVGSGDKPGA